ncbi:YdcH family protein [Salmonella enterica subsp. enterica serovar Muenster]|uniref:YdcH family protein n=1 Tax=Salmonella enterica TaxID=28901 RepID=UPI001601FC29|nr:YdcH family protein [Salmonella enterica]EHX6838314.1 YdcH family protein [Salmonella enterica subsp. enterica serovar Muenster]EIS1581522.1 YdcH family protein [Salmonella enterica subsp. enterica serovar Brandenburg]ELA5060116.1 YdcH family protein [Salmonella enterica subsp. enterica serovar Brandenburg]
MFPEYRDLISRLKTQHPRFHLLFKKHNELDHEIARLEEENGHGSSQEVVKLKKEKLQIKDAIYQILLEESLKFK